MRQMRSAQELAAVVLRSGKVGRNNVQYGYTRMKDCRTRNVTAFAHSLAKTLSSTWLS